MDELVHLYSNLEINPPFESTALFYDLLFKHPSTPWNPWTFDFSGIEFQGIDTNTLGHLMFRLRGIIDFMVKKHKKTITGYSVFRSRFHEFVVVIAVKNNDITFKTVANPICDVK